MIPKTAYTTVRQQRRSDAFSEPGSGLSRNTTPVAASLASRLSIPSKATDKPNTEPNYSSFTNEIAQEFLDSLRSLTTRDFEHAASLDDHDVPGKKDVTYTQQIKNGPHTRPKSRKGSANASVALEGFNFFSNSNSTQASTRPSTVPRYLGKNVIGDGPGKPDGKGGGTTSGKMRPLIKSKVTPSQVDQVYIRNSRRGTPLSGNSSDSSIRTCDSEQRRPSSASSSKRVTFAADTVNYERENKPPRKRKLSKKKRQGFPHPSRGIFVPPDVEIVESSGPGGNCKNNPYLFFNQVWTHPAARSTGESSASKLIRTERFHRLMSDLELAHIQYNRLANPDQNNYLTQCIFKRYVLVLDLALTEGQISQVEHLLDTISKSIPVLHQNVFYYLYGPKMIKDDENNNKVNANKPVPNNNSCYHPDILLIGYALARISDDQPRQDVLNMSLETILVKLCMEIMEVVYSPYGSLVFREALNTLPYTVRQAINLLKNLRTSKDAFCYIKWINNSAVQRDFRSILKNLDLLDRYGCKAEIPGVADIEFQFKQRKPTTAPPANNNSGTVKRERGNKGPSHKSFSGENRRGRVASS